MSANPQRVLRDAIRDNKFAAVYYLFGEDDYLKEQAVQQLVEAAIDPATRDFNLEVRRGSDLDAETLGLLLEERVPLPEALSRKMTTAISTSEKPRRSGFLVANRSRCKRRGVNRTGRSATRTSRAWLRSSAPTRAVEPSSPRRWNRWP